MARFIKLSFVLLTVAAALTMTACSGKTNGSEPSATPENSAGSVAPTTTQTATPKELITLTVWPGAFAWNIPSGVQEDPVAKEIEKKLNIKMDLDTHPTDEKFTALLASGSLADVVLVDISKFKKQVVGSDAFIDLSSLVEQYGADIVKNASKAIEYSKKYWSEDPNKFSFIPIGVSALTEKPAIAVNELYVGPFLRWDYYKEIGAPELKSDEDFINAVDQMIKKHPTNEDGQKYVGFSPWFDWGSFFTVNNWGAAIQNKTPIGEILQVDKVTTAEEGNLYTKEDSTFWHGVSFWYKVNQKGLLDPDAFTQKYENAIQKASANKVLAGIINWPFEGANPTFVKNGQSTSGYVSAPIPYAGANTHVGSAAPWGTNFGLAISKNAGNPERAMELINYLYSLEGAMTVYNGLEGTDWEMENGKAILTEAYYTNIKEAEFYQRFGYQKYTNITGLGPGFINPDTQQPLLLVKTTEAQIRNMTDLQKDQAAFYKVDNVADVQAAGGKSIINMAGLAASFMPIEPDDIKITRDKIKQYVDKTVPKLILAKSDAAYEELKQQFIKEIKELGVEEVYEYYKVEYAKSSEQAKEFLN